MATPTLLPGLAGRTAVGAALSGGLLEAALILTSDGTVLGAGHDVKAEWDDDDGEVVGRRVLGRLPGVDDPTAAAALTPLPALHR